MYGSSRVPASTLHSLAIVLSYNSALSMSLRVSHPLRSTSTHPDPNSSRSYPVLGARPFTGSASTAATAEPAAGSLLDWSGSGDGDSVTASLGVPVGVGVGRGGI